MHNLRPNSLFPGRLNSPYPHAPSSPTRPQLNHRRMADHMFQMQREMDAVMNALGLPDPFGMDLFERAAAPLVARRAPGALAGSPLAAAARLVPLEVEEDDKGYTVTAEVPGFDKNEIKVRPCGTAGYYRNIHGNYQECRLVRLGWTANRVSRSTSWMVFRSNLCGDGAEVPVLAVLALLRFA